MEKRARATRRDAGKKENIGCVIGATVVNLQVGIFILRQSVSIVFVSGFIVQFFKTMHKSE